MPPPDSGGTRKLLPLEALRGMAAIGVLLWHFGLAFLPRYFGSSPYREHDLFIGTPFFVLFNGHAMVVIFYLLSGYVLALKGRRPDAVHAIRDAAIKRWFRLAPLVCFSTLLSWALFHLGLYHFTDVAIMNDSGRLSNIMGGWNQQARPPLFSALRMGLYGAFAGEFPLSFNMNLWTIKGEWFGSYMAFLMALGLPYENRRRTAAPLFIVVLCLFLVWWLAGTSPFHVGVTDLIWIVPFPLGAAAALLPFDRLVFGRAAAFIMVATGLYFCGFFQPQGCYRWLSGLPQSISTQRALLNSLGGFFLLMVFITDNAVSRRFQGAGSRMLGKASFPLYLTHTLIITSFSSWAYMALGGGAPGTLAALGVFLVVSLPLVWALARFDAWWLELLARWHPLSYAKAA
jgi:peptidoglycan/LPS O-acetylase OafA/YrhL